MKNYELNSCGAVSFFFLFLRLTRKVSDSFQAADGRDVREAEWVKTPERREYRVFVYVTLGRKYDCSCTHTAALITFNNT